MTDTSHDLEPSAAVHLHQLADLVALSGEVKCLLDARGICVATSQSLLDALGKRRDELLGCTAAEPGNHDALGALLGALAERSQTDGRLSEQRWWDFPSWGFRYVEIALEPLTDDQGEREGTLVCVRDLTDARLARDALEESERRFEDFSQLSDGWLWELNAELRFVYLSRRFENLMELPPSEVLGQRRMEAFPEEDMGAPETRRHWRDLESRRAFEDYRLTRRLGDGSLRVSLLSGKPAFDAHGRFLGYRGIARDVTAHEHLCARVVECESQDPLTGLVNRPLFLQRLGRVLGTAGGEDGSEHGLCYVDIDQFRLINERCGHEAGDRLLRALADILRDQARKRDTLARAGGDEFAILMEHCTPERLQRVAHATRRAIHDFRFHCNHEEFTLGVSIGVVPITGSMRRVDDVLRAAELACHAAKTRGRDYIHIYHAEDDESRWRRDEMQWAARVDRALVEQRMQLCLQPVVPMNGAGTAGDSFEVLMRLCDERDDMVAPGAFLGAAERYHLCERLDRWVVSTTIDWLGENDNLMRRLDACFINLSAHSIADDEFLRFILESVKSSPIPSRKICFEITEAAAIADIESVRRFVLAIKQGGCRFSLDDFGGGSTSITRLRSLPVDFLKIDGDFVKEMVDSPLDLAMVRSINEMGHVMGRKTIAEFVENDAVLSKVRELGVDYAQGYALGRPRALVEA